MKRIGSTVDLVVDSLATQSSSSSAQASEIVAIADASQLPPLRSWEEDQARRLVVFSTSVAGINGDGQLILRRQLDDKTRSGLERRVRELERAVEPCREDSRERLLAAISGMLGSFPAMHRYDRVTALSVAAAYLWTVRERPPWAIVDACNLIRAGEAELHRSYCPSEGDFNQVVKQRVAPYVDALRRARRLLDADVEPEPIPKPSGEEIEAKLGRKLTNPQEWGGGNPAIAECASTATTVSPHATRVMADLARRRAQRESANQGTGQDEATLEAGRRDGPGPAA